jgi:acyl-coenzyme A synthetase/AMP-(fatty) acid ligase
MNALRFILQCVLVVLLVTAVIAIFTSGTGGAEKIVLVAFIAVLVYAATQVRRLGATPSS